MTMEEQFKLLEEMSDTKMSLTEREIIKAYSESLKTIKSQLNYMYELYSIDGKLEYADMMKYNRLKTLEKTITDELITLTKVNANLLKTSLEVIFETNYYYTGFIVETGIQTKLGYSVLNPKVIEVSIQNPISGLTLNERLIKNRENIIIAIRQQITQGLIVGESYSSMSSRIKQVLENNASKSILIAQTEAHRVRCEGKELSYQHIQSKGIEFNKVWLSTLDKRTRSNHRKLDGQVADADGYFHLGKLKAKYPGGFSVADEDIRCRCTTRVQFDELEPTKRKDNETKEIVPYTNYEEWHKNRVINSK